MTDDENACVRNIVKEIMRECYPRKIKVNKNFVTYLTKLLLIDPNWGIDDDFFNQREHVQKFVSYVTEDLLTEQDKPKLITLKIQFYFSCNLEHMNYLIELNRKDLMSRLAPLKDDICNTIDISDKEAMDVLCKKIVYYITLATGLGNPKKAKVYEEALIALKSIIDEDELKEFLVAAKNWKHERLEQLTKIVAGIRLFNKDCEKGGEGIENLPDLLNRATDVVKKGTETIISIIMETVNILTTVVDKCHVMMPTYKGYQMQLQIPEEVSKFVFTADVECMKDSLIFFRQYEVLIRKILEELELIHDKTHLIFGNMETILKKIHDTVYMRIAIPVGTVFPLFEELSEIWALFQDQVLLLSRYSQIMSNLETYAKHTHFNHYLYDQILRLSGSMTDAERLAETAHLRIISSTPSVQVFSIESIKNIDTLELEYLGFCCWKFVETGGALIPGNPSMGIARYQRKNYVFSRPEAFDAFCEDPQKYVNSVLALAREKPQLINFFQVKDELESVFGIEKLVQSQEEIRLCENKSVQVVDHIEESYIDPDYKWNIWDLKRYVLTMANISSEKTVSTQTDKGGSKNSVKTQTYSTKEVEIMTRKENYTNMPKPSNFIYGLRGRKDDNQFVIDLTRPVDE